MRMGKFAAFLPIFIPAAGGASVPSACKSWDFFASLGDKKRNTEIRELRENARNRREPKAIELWGIWNEY